MAVDFLNETLVAHERALQDADFAALDDALAQPCHPIAALARDGIEQGGFALGKLGVATLVAQHPWVVGRRPAAVDEGLDGAATHEHIPWEKRLRFRPPYAAELLPQLTRGHKTLVDEPPGIESAQKIPVCELTFSRRLENVRLCSAHKPYGPQTGQTPALRCHASSQKPGLLPFA